MIFYMNLIDCNWMIVSIKFADDKLFLGKILFAQAMRQFAVFAVMSYAGAALAMSGTIFRAGASNVRVVWTVHVFLFYVCRCKYNTDFPFMVKSSSV